MVREIYWHEIFVDAVGEKTASGVNTRTKDPQTTIPVERKNKTGSGGYFSSKKANLLGTGSA